MIKCIGSTLVDILLTTNTLAKPCTIFKIQSKLFIDLLLK